MSFSRLSLLAIVGGLACFAMFRVAANQLPSSFFADTVDSLGMLYGTLLFSSGLFAVLAALTKDLWHGRDGQIIPARWIVFLPALIGMVGVVHGYLSLTPHYASLPEDIVLPHNTIWATVAVGAMLTTFATAIVFAGRGEGRRHPRSTG